MKSLKDIQLPRHLVGLDPSVYLGETYLVLDFETRSDPEDDLSYGQAPLPTSELLSAAWHMVVDGKIQPRFKEGSEFEMQELLKDIQDITKAGGFVVAHSAQYEIAWLQRMGLDTWNHLFYCTKVSERVRAGNRAMSLHLKDCALRYNCTPKQTNFGVLFGDGCDHSYIPSHWMERYVKSDVLTTNELFRKQRKYLKDNGLLPVAFTRNIVIPVISELESTGMCLDPDAVRREAVECRRVVDQLREELDKLTGGINLNSSQQKAVFLYDVLKFPAKKNKQTGEEIRKADKDTLAALVPRTKKQKEFVEAYQKWSQQYHLWAKNLSKMLDCVEDAEKNGTKPIVYFKYSQTTCKTHRWSSTGAKYRMQGQNMPRAYKKLFTTRHPEWQVGEGDGAQLEFRVAAYLGQDAQAMADIANDEDVHSFTAAVIFADHDRLKHCGGREERFECVKTGRKEDPELDELRSKSKPYTFRPLYGGGDNDTTNGYCQAFKDKYWQLAQEQYNWSVEVMNHKKLRIASGLIFYWPWCRMSKNGYIEYSTEIYNYPVQNLATAEIIPIAVTYLWTYMKLLELKSFIVNAIHDSAITETHPEEVDILESCYRQAFVGDVYSYLSRVYDIDFNVPLEVDFKVSRNWNLSDDKNPALIH